MITNSNTHEFEVHKFSAFASDLGLAPGEWPSSLPTSLGNGLPFLVSFHRGNEVHYTQQFGCIKLTVLND